MKKSLIFPALLILGIFLLSSVAAFGATTVANRKVDVSSAVTEGDTTVVPRATLTGDGVVNKYALIIGISDYKAINDLSFCDEDATDWYNFLAGEGYEITLLGDGSNYYPQWDGYATEYNIKTVTANILAQADGDDIFVYASSGHGAEIRIGKGRYRTYQQVICCWDCSAGEDGEDGILRDYEFEAMFATAATNCFIFLDHCYSGGMNEVMNNVGANIYMCTTCTDDGYGYDVPAYNNGAWTYFFLEYSLIGHFGGDATMEEAFAYAAADYPYDGGDMCMEFDGDAVNPFYL